MYNAKADTSYVNDAISDLSAWVQNTYVTKTYLSNNHYTKTEVDKKVDNYNSSIKSYVDDNVSTLTGKVNTSINEVSTKVDDLVTKVNNIVGGPNGNGTLDKFEEIKQFLQGYSDSPVQKLQDLLANTKS